MDDEGRPEAVQEEEGSTASADKYTLTSEIAGHKYPLRDLSFHY